MLRLYGFFFGVNVMNEIEELKELVEKLTLRIVKLELWKRKSRQKTPKKKDLYTPLDWCKYIGKPDDDVNLVKYLLKRGMIEYVLVDCCFSGYKTSLEEFSLNNKHIAGKYFVRFPASFYEKLDYYWRI